MRMSGFKKTIKSKFISSDNGDLTNGSHSLKTSPNTVKPKKRECNNVIDEEQKMANLICEYRTTLMKRNVDTQIPAYKESSLKLLSVMTEQMNQRKLSHDVLLKNLSEHLAEVETDHNVMKENVKKLEQYTETYMKCLQQTSAAYKQKMDNLKGIKSSFEKKRENLEKSHKTEINKLADELEEDIEKLQGKLVSEAKRSSLETLRKSIFHAMKNDF